MTTRPLDHLTPILGEPIPGGCDACTDPVQILTRHHTGTWLLTTHHDDHCPVLARHEGRQP